MIRTLLAYLASKLPPPRIIFDRAGVSKYLSRWYLFAAPTMPDGSHPFDPDGSPREGIQEPNRPFAIFLHRFHRGDDDAELHNHPWTWAFAIVLSGGYREEYRRGAPDGGGAVFVRELRPLSFNLIHHDTFHRVTLLEKDAWSIFVAGPREKNWGFWNRASGRYLPWREFINWRRDPTAFRQDDARRRGSTNTLHASGVPGVWPGSELDRRLVQSREHCVGDEPLVEVEIFVEEMGPCTSDGDDCRLCDRRRQGAEAGDLSLHRAVTFS